MKRPKVRPTPEQREFGLRLQRLREAAGYSVKAEFARQIETSANTVYRIERAEVVPSIDTLRAWARVCGVVDSLLTPSTIATDAASASPEHLEGAA